MAGIAATSSIASSLHISPACLPNRNYVTPKLTTSTRVKLCYSQLSLQMIPRCSDSHRQELQEHHFPYSNEVWHRVRHRARTCLHSRKSRTLKVYRHASEAPEQPGLIQVDRQLFYLSLDTTQRSNGFCVQVRSTTSPGTSTSTIETLLTSPGHVEDRCAHIVDSRAWN